MPAGSIVVGRVKVRSNAPYVRSKRCTRSVRVSDSCCFVPLRDNTLPSTESCTWSGLIPGSSAWMRIASASSKMSTGGVQDAAALSRYSQSRFRSASLKNRLTRCSRAPTSGRARVIVSMFRPPQKFTLIVWCCLAGRRSNPCAASNRLLDAALATCYDQNDTASVILAERRRRGVPVNMRRASWQFALWLGLAGSAAAQQAGGYRLYVVSESGDIVSELTWDGSALKVIKTVPVGIMPADIDGPHNVTVSPDGKFYYVTIAHGTPYGSLWKMAVDGDTLVGRGAGGAVPTPHPPPPGARPAPPAARRPRLRGELGFPRRPPPDERRIRGLHAADDSRHQPAGVRHAARRQGQPRGDSGLRELHELGRGAGDRPGVARHHAAPAHRRRHAPVGDADGPRWREGARRDGARRLLADLRFRRAGRPPAVRGLQPQRRADGVRCRDARGRSTGDDRSRRIQCRAIPRREMGHRDEQKGPERLADRRRHADGGGPDPDHEAVSAWGHLLAGQIG